MRRAVGSDTSPQCSTPSARWSAQRGTDVLDERDAPRLRARRGVGGAHPRAPGVGARPPPARRVAGSRLHRECRRRNLRRAGVPRRDPGRCVPSDRGAHPRQHRSGASCTWKPAAKNALPSTRRRSSRPARRGRGSGSPALGNRPASSAHRAAHAREGEVDGDGATFLHLLAATACEERHWARSGRLDVSTRLRRHLRSVRRPNGVQAVPSSAVVLSTGARRSEALGRDVDFERRQITIRRAFTKAHQADGAHRSSTCGRSGSVPLGTHSRPWLSRQAAASGSSPSSFQDAAEEPRHLLDPAVGIGEQTSAT